MKSPYLIALGLVIILSVFSSVLAVDISVLDTKNENRLSFSHILIINNISTTPLDMIPGNPGALNLLIYNSGDLPAKDIRVKLNLPTEIAFINDVSEKRAAELKPSQQKDFSFDIITLPSTEEGIHKASLTIDYVNAIGEARQDNYSIGIVVKSTPKIFAQIEKSDIYSEKRTGDLTITFTNNDLANIKFLTVELADSENYEIISSNKKYIGDLDSDDFQSVIFTLRVKATARDVNIPLRIYYKDSLNKDYYNEIMLPFQVRTEKELGIENNNYYFVIVGAVLLILVLLYYYREKIFGKKNKDF